MTTKKHEDEKPVIPPVDAGKKHDPAAEKRLPTDDPMASPPYDVHAPNPPSEGEK